MSVSWRLRLAVFVCVVSSGPAAARASAVDLSELEKTALAEMKAGGIPGAAIAIVKGDKVIYSRGLGVASVETGVPVAAEMLFRLGSTTKVFVSAAMVSLAEEGKIKLKEPIGTYVRGLHPKLARVSVHQLLTHTAGLTDESPMHGPPEDAALARGIRGLKDEYFFTEPGAIYSYSNVGYWAAGVVLEEITGRPFADEMQRRLFKPLGMNRTTFRPTLAMTYPLAVGHQLVNGKPQVVRPFSDNAATWPAGQMFCNVLDFARFTIAFMNEGRLDGKQVLSPTLIASLATGYADTPHTGGKYGYGLGLRESRGLQFLGHGGSRLGHGSSLLIVPKEKVAVIIVANRTGAALPRAAARAIDLLFPTATKAKTAPKKEMQLSADELTRFAGTYSNNRQTIKLVARDGKLQTAQGGRVQKIGPDRLLLSDGKDGTPQEIVLAGGADGSLYLIRQARALKKVK